MNTGSCRIISGKWRGRKVSFEDADGLRPTTDRIRETVFNWLQPYVARSYCLDCFAGSGVLGLEALSRGADEVVFIEKNKKTVTNLKQNIQQLKADSAVVFQGDVLSLLEPESINKLLLTRKINLVFLDPPFQSDILCRASTLLNSSGCLAEDALIYIEHAVNDKITFPDQWECLKEKSAGQVSFKLYQT